MALPFFFVEEITTGSNEFILNEETSKHLVQVLRMQNGEQIQLTDGKGTLFTAEIIDNNRKNCTVTITQTINNKQQAQNLTIAISLIKNSSRFEWFLEKATEMGITEIIPLLCERTEKQHFRFGRMKNILVSAMLQSQQYRLPMLHEPVHFDKLWQLSKTSPKLEEYQQKFIAHCIEEEKRDLADMINENLSSKIILIGPEGDFTTEEIRSAIQHHFIPVALGATRLRTETAGVVAAALLTQL